MDFKHFTLRQVGTTVVVLSVGLAWLADRRAMRYELADARSEVQRLNGELAVTTRQLSRMRDDYDDLRFVRIEEDQELESLHQELVERVRPFGVRLYFDRLTREIGKAEVPDTTNIEVVCHALKELPDLSLVYFTTGPFFLDRVEDWTDEEYSSAYAEAVNRPLVVRTVALSESYRARVLACVRECLPDVEVREWAGAF